MHSDSERTDLERELSLAELVNRVLDKGAVISGDVLISVAGVDLIHVGLQLVVAAAESEFARHGVSRSITEARRRARLDD
jgi:hypothetical protein